ncbi:MAG: hypothetical protein ACK4TC_17715 [Sphingomonas pseudosanguinis]
MLKALVDGAALPPETHPVSGTITPKLLKKLRILRKSLLVTAVCYNRSEARMSAYLLKRDGGTYYFRRSIPLG